jgi:hypothetical protein
MQFTTAVLAVLATAGVTLAAPSPNVQMATGSTWTIQDFKRACANNVCTYTYGINTNDGSAVTGCAYQVSGNPAERASYNNVHCGNFVISSNWSGQFGEGNGFQTLAVVRGKQIAYPAYNDAQLANGATVKPDQSYPVQNLP